MAETERDEKVAQGYRALGSEEPPRALDEAILAAARRRPARWRVPLSIAAVLVLAVGVTLRMLPPQREAESVALAPQVLETPRPAAPPAEPLGKLERSAPPAAARARAAPESARVAVEEARATPEEARAPRQEARSAADVATQAGVAAATTGPRGASEGAAASAREEAVRFSAEDARPDAAAAPAPRALAAAKLAAPATPEAWLERIAELKKQGRTREAEESLAEFRKRYPGYKVPDALLR